MRSLRPVLALCLGLAACARTAPSSSGDAPTSPSSAPVATASTSVVAPGPRERRVPERREGQALVLAEAEEALYLADEDHARLRRVALTPELAKAPPLPTSARVSDRPPSVDLDAVETSVELPGRPAQVLSMGDRVLVTVRDPGLLLVLRAGSLTELGRVALPADAWGLSISPDGRDAYVTSAWTRKLSRVDVSADAPRLVWSVDVAREPRGVAVAADGSHVYVTHLMGAAVTRVDVAGDGPGKASRVELPPDPLETLAGEKLNASLAYAAILSPDGHRLFTARHAMGAFWAWQGTTTIDGLDTATDTPLSPVRKGKAFGTFTSQEKAAMSWLTDGAGFRADGDHQTWVVPRAMVYRKKTRHLLVASEGMALVAELDAMSMSPALITNRFYRLGGLVEKPLPEPQFAPKCGAPTGLALSRDEDVLWVYCRTTDNVVAVRLSPDGQRARRDETTYIEGGAIHDRGSPLGPFAHARLAVPAMDAELSLGRRYFFDAQDRMVSGNMSCAGCHPDGRDDGQVWREQPVHNGGPRDFRFLAGPSLSFVPDTPGEPQVYGSPRQTAQLAGRVSQPGPYGWHGESETLVDRVRAGFALHRADVLRTDGLTLRSRAEPLARFVREGLVSPPRPAPRAPTPEEERGKQLFASAETKCSTCHVPEKAFSDRPVAALRGFGTLPLFSADPNPGYKIPSLFFVGGTEPYYHDGSAASLEELIDRNLDRMGKTSHLSADDRAALVAYLRTL